MPKFKIKHITKYTYDSMVRDSANQIMLYPIEDEYQEVILQQLSVTGSPSIEIHSDIFENKVGTFTHSKPHSELVINLNLEVVTIPRKLPEETMGTTEQWAELKTIRNQFPFIDLTRIEAFNALPELEKVIHEIHHDTRSPLACAQSFCDYVFHNFTYMKGVTTVDTTLDEIWKLQSGVCQDFAHILLAMLRLVTIPARYVSGYICPNKNGMRGEGATHAWVEAFIPQYGWLGIDPTNNCMVNENHVRLAVGKNYYDCSPVRGTYRGTAGHTLEVEVTVGYEDGHINTPAETKEEVGKANPVIRNSFRIHQEMQMQQQ